MPCRLMSLVFHMQGVSMIDERDHEGSIVASEERDGRAARERSMQEDGQEDGRAKEEVRQPWLKSSPRCGRDCCSCCVLLLLLLRVLCCCVVLYCASTVQWRLL